MKRTHIPCHQKTKKIETIADIIAIVFIVGFTGH